MKRRSFLLTWLFCALFLVGSTAVAAAMPRVAVVPFANKVPVATNLSRSANLDIAMEAAIFAVQNTGKFDVVERAELQRLLDELGLGMNPLFDPSSCAKIGKFLGAQYVVLGSVTSISRLNDSGKINVGVYARMIEVETARVMLVGRGKATGTGDVNDLLEKAVDDAMSGKQGMLTQFFQRK